MGLHSELLARPLLDVWRLISSREISPVEITQLTLERAVRLAPHLNCYISLLSERALSRARALEEEASRGSIRPLHGIPISIKDNIDVAGVPTTAGSALLNDYVPTRDATVVGRLEEAGAIVVAKANMYEFAFGGPNAKFGRTRNPWSLSRTSGGSSSGSAASVAAGLCFGSIGTDTGGSIRIPAAFCGVVGVKPTFGRVSRAGVFPGSSSLDHVGPIARTVADSFALLRVMSGPDGQDRAARMQRELPLRLDPDLHGLRIGLAIPDCEELRPDVKVATVRAAGVIANLGATVEEVPIPSLSLARTVMWVISGVEAADLHRTRLRQRPNDYSPTVRLRLERAEFIPATDYVLAQRLRQRFADELRAIFRGIDALVVPGCSEPAYPIGPPDGRVDRSDLAALGRASLLTALFSITGHPVVAVPCGLSGGLPLAIQVVARHEEEEICMRIAHAYEQATPWHLRLPSAVDTSPAVTADRVCQ